jgi:uncharacterized protein (UPF0548 family)
MFLIRRPSTADVDRFLDRCRDLPLSYTPIGILGEPPGGRQLDEQAVVIGRGKADFERARAALLTWKHFNLGWVEAFPDRPRIEAGSNIAVLIRHLGFWSLNGARVLELIEAADGCSIGFTYGTLTNHAESGEELFEVSVNPQSGEVAYRIRAVSWAQSPLAWIGQPIVRLLQAQFRKDSAAAMKRELK